MTVVELKNEVLKLVEAIKTKDSVAVFGSLSTLFSVVVELLTDKPLMGACPCEDDLAELDKAVAELKSVCPGECNVTFGDAVDVTKIDPQTILLIFQLVSQIVAFFRK